MAIRELYPEADGHIRRGCDWILTNMDQEGRLHTPDQSQWNEEDTSDLIHLYCLTPLYEAAAVFDIPEYAEKADRIKAYYIQNRMDEIMGFRLLSHFLAYVLETWERQSLRNGLWRTWSISSGRTGWFRPIVM